MVSEGSPCLTKGGLTPCVSLTCSAKISSRYDTFYYALGKFLSGL